MVLPGSILCGQELKSLAYHIEVPLTQRTILHAEESRALAMKEKTIVMNRTERVGYPQIMLSCGDIAVVKRATRVSSPEVPAHPQ